MKNIDSHLSSALGLALLCSLLSVSPAGIADSLPRERIQDANGLIVFDAPARPVANPPLPPLEERAYWERANHVIRHFDGRIGVRTEGEQEKDSFPVTMFSYLTGHHDRVIAALMTPDRQAGTDHAWTLGIDLYWAFTLKGQMRKYFLFGPSLEPDYRQRMFDAGKIWTADDPRPSFELVNSLQSNDPLVRGLALDILQTYRANIAELAHDAVNGTVRDRYADEDLGDDFESWERWWRQYSVQGWQVYEDIERLANPFPHPLHGVGSGPVGGRWDPGVRGTRADARNTDNLRAMRDIAVYLMAEETGNEAVRRLYRDKIQRFVSQLYRYHHGEWDSENYLHHTIAPYHNLHDFARDEEMVALAKAALDYLYTAAAVKYVRGHAVAPTKRVGGGLNRFVWLAFGDTPEPMRNPEYDLFHAVTSSYRPPLAVLRVARGEFPRPAEMINTKPTYSFWLPGGRDAPETWETVYYGKSFYLGSATSLSPQGDVRPFEMQMHTRDGGAAPFMANSHNNFNGLRPGDQIGQYRNLVVWLRRDQNARFSFQLPGRANVVTEQGHWFVEFDKTYLAIRPLNLDPEAIAPVARASSGNTRFEARQQGGSFAGFAFQAADAEDYNGFADFRQRFLREANLDLGELEAGRVTFTATDGHTLGYTWSRDDRRPRVVRDGTWYNWDENKNPYQPMDDNAPVSVGWESGRLTIRAGEDFFEQDVGEDGSVEFRVTP